MSEQVLLELLADGRFHDGDSLGAKLGIGRAAVWKQVQKLQAQGVDIHAIKGKGYRLPTELELLDHASLSSALAVDGCAQLSRLHLFRSIDSTNQFISSRFLEGGGHREVCLAEMQRAGRGRRGRVWCSPFATNLYLSVGWEFSKGIAWIQGLSLAIGVMIADAIDACGGQDCQLKWPNDVLLGDRKLAGVLIELVGDPMERCRVVIGVGINHKMAESAGRDIDQPWCRLMDYLPQLSRQELTVTVIQQLLMGLAEFEEKGLAAFLARWAQLDLLRDKPVTVNNGATTMTGIATGISADGSLIVKTAAGDQAIYGGEVSVRAC